MDVRRASTVLRCPDGLPLALEAFAPTNGGGPWPVSVLCHGFKGFKAWGMFVPLAERLAASGRGTLLFDFSHNGVGDVPDEFTRLDLFREQTVTRHLEDLGIVLDFLDTGSGLVDELCLAADRRYAVAGHSMGGGVALLRAAADGRVSQVATLNGVSRFGRVSKELLAQLERTGQVPIPNARTGQVMPLGRAWFDDLAQHDLRASAAEVFVPVLVVQGEADESVGVEEGRALADWIPGARLVTVPGAGHTFGARHPFAGWTPGLEAAFEALDGFLPSAAP